MLDKNGVEIKIGDKFKGFRFFSEGYPTIVYVEAMDKDIGKVLMVTYIGEHSGIVSGNEGWSYPAKLIEIIVDKVENSDTITTSNRPVLWAVYDKTGTRYGVEDTRRKAHDLNRQMGGGLQIFKMQVVKQSN